MIILFQNIPFLKEFPECNGCFGLFRKIKKGSGATFWCTFSAWFFYKNVPYWTLYQWTKFPCHTLFLSHNIKQNVLCFSLDRWWHNKLRFFLNQPVKQWLAGRKRGEDKNTQIWISQERKELFRWNKKHFSKFLKDYHLVKNTQALIKLNNIH